MGSTYLILLNLFFQEPFVLSVAAEQRSRRINGGEQIIFILLLHESNRPASCSGRWPRNKNANDGCHCEERQRRRNPFLLLAFLWIATPSSRARDDATGVIFISRP